MPLPNSLQKDGVATSPVVARYAAILSTLGSASPSPVRCDLAKFVMATVHPSSLLRAPDPERRHEEYRLFVQDLKTIPKRITAVRLSA